MGRFPGLTTGLALALCAIAAPAAGAHHCDTLAAEAPRIFGEPAGAPAATTAEICVVQSASKKSTLMARVSPMKRASVLIPLMRQSAENAGNGRIADEGALGAGAWSKNQGDSIELHVPVGATYVMVMLEREPRLASDDAAKARALARVLMAGAK